MLPSQRMRAANKMPMAACGLSLIDRAASTRRESSLRTSCSGKRRIQNRVAQEDRGRGRNPFRRNSAVMVVAELPVGRQRKFRPGNPALRRIDPPCAWRFRAATAAPVTVESPAICGGSASDPPLIRTRKCTRGTPLRCIIAMTAPFGSVSRVYGGSLTCAECQGTQRRPSGERSSVDSFALLGGRGLLGNQGGDRAILLDEILPGDSLNVGRRDRIPAV